MAGRGKRHVAWDRLSCVDVGALEEALGYALMIVEPDESGRTLGELSFKQARRGDAEGALR
ncbi:MAG: hypothetical protein LZF60_80493 [Nitrospira sp.]|nr:MAG: hypothetical protein LZF60_80493 [Nitrospira sp.]